MKKKKQSALASAAQDAQAALVIRPDNLPPHRVGRAATGLYPQVSRTLLAAQCGIHITTVTSILSGRTRMPTEIAAVLTRALGIGLDELVADLAEQKQRYIEMKQKKKAKRERLEKKMERLERLERLGQSMAGQ